MIEGVTSWAPTRTTFMDAALFSVNAPGFVSINPSKVLVSCLVTARGSILKYAPYHLRSSSNITTCPVSIWWYTKCTMERGGTSPFSSDSSIRHLSPVSNKWVTAGCVQYPIRKLVGHMWQDPETVEHPCHPIFHSCFQLLQPILDTNPQKNRIIHQISTNPVSTPLGLASPCP